MICSTMKANSRNEAPVESMRDESPLMIIEKEEEARRRESFFCLFAVICFDWQLEQSEIVFTSFFFF